MFRPSTPDTPAERTSARPVSGGPTGRALMVAALLTIVWAWLPGLLTVLDAAPQEAVFQGTTDVVRVFVTVIDGDGRLVTTLTREDFELRDEGDRQPITLFDNSPQPIRTVVMLDLSGSMVGNLSLLRAASDQLFARLLPEDGARVGTFGHDIVISPEFTNDRNTLRQALPSAAAPDAPTPLWLGLEQAMDVLGGGRTGDPRTTRAEAAFGAAGNAGRETRPSGDGELDADGFGDARRVILVLSDGKDSGPTSFRGPVSSQSAVIDRAREEDVMIYALGLRSRGAQPRLPGFGAAGLRASLTADLPDPGLARVAEETGGGYRELRPREDLGEAFAQVADELHSQYLLGFAPPKRDGKVHDVDVRIGQRGMKARARKGYVAPEKP